ncbi:cupin domain-containing protein [Fusarium napiforme]|uniref:Cupin domain-containing protein n=1 Tax=Fusarium napiforme TaxID=42672 RepID=A0A8H5NER5_9HYPO|nr:cupin domain-containing protein [Fusarium napiforme]
MSLSVECYLVPRTEDAPNNRLPILVYRDVLPYPRTEETVTRFLTAHRWEKRGTWGHIAIRHFHPNSHECYGIFQGSSTLLLGKIQKGKGVEVPVKAGDVIVLPAGTAHSSLESSSDYRYIGVYPKGCPKWRNEMGKKSSSVFLDTIDEVAMPEDDPVYGPDGPLPMLWRQSPRAKL